MALEWLYMKLCPGDVRLLDDVVCTLVGPCRAEALERGAARWFFIRYMDESGPHIRLRVQATTAVVDALYALWRQRLGPCLSALSACRTGLMGEPAVVFTVYEPEWQTYGGAQGVALAEQAFEVSSEATLHLIGASPNASARLALASLLMQKMIDGVPTLNPEDFWKQHHRFWTPPGVDPATQPRGFTADASDIIEKLKQRLSQTHSIETHIDAVCRATSEAIARAMNARVGVSAAHLLLHHMHMSVNRLGVIPAQERALGEDIALRGSAPALADHVPAETDEPHRVFV